MNPINQKIHDDFRFENRETMIDNKMPMEPIRMIFRDASTNLDAISETIVRPMSRVSWHDSLSGPWHIADDQRDKSRLVETAMSRSNSPKTKKVALGQNMTCLQ